MKIFLKLSVISAFLLFSCTEKSNVQITENIPDIQCIDGVLHFASANIFFETIEKLSISEERALFEQEYGFKSLISKVDSAFKEISLLPEDTRYEEYLEIVQSKYSDILKVDKSGVASPIVKSDGYSSILNNIHSCYYISNVKHEISYDKIIIHDVENNKQESFSIYAYPENFSTKSTTLVNLSNNSYHYFKSKNRRIGATLTLAIYVAYDYNAPDPNKPYQCVTRLESTFTHTTKNSWNYVATKFVIEYFYWYVAFNNNGDGYNSSTFYNIGNSIDNTSYTFYSNYSTPYWRSADNPDPFIYFVSANIFTRGTHDKGLSIYIQSNRGTDIFEEYKTSSPKPN